ncbi:MAG: hypothetical protein ACE5IE_01935 [Dehalococcoidia bacterium]
MAIIIREGLGGIRIEKEGDATLANQLGKRYFCEKCGSEMIVTKGGEGNLHCCGQPMTMKK